MTLRYVSQRERRKVRVTKGQHPRSEIELPHIAADVAQRLQCDERTSHGGSREPSLARHLRQGETWPFGRETADHCKAAFQGVYEIGWTLNGFDHAKSAPHLRSVAERDDNASGAS